MTEESSVHAVSPSRAKGEGEQTDNTRMLNMLLELRKDLKRKVDLLDRMETQLRPGLKMGQTGIKKRKGPGDEEDADKRNICRRYSRGRCEGPCPFGKVHRCFRCDGGHQARTCSLPYFSFKVMAVRGKEPSSGRGDDERKICREYNKKDCKEPCPRGRTHRCFKCDAEHRAKGCDKPLGSWKNPTTLPTGGTVGMASGGLSREGENSAGKCWLV